jgi:acetyl-CoA carboxylase beta subunit
VLEKGFVDRIVHRKQMRVEVGALLRYFWHATRGFAPEGGTSPHAYDPNAPRSDS